MNQSSFLASFPGLGTGGLDGAALAFDAADDDLLAFGGQWQCSGNCSTFGGFLNQTWVGVNDTWQLLNLSNLPSSRLGPTLAYDPSLGGTIMFGGWTESYYASPATWLWQGGAWTQLNTTVSPPGRWSASLVWDPDLQALVLFGGNNGFTNFNDTWELANGTWQNITPTHSPPGLVWPSMAYDPAIGGLVEYGGCIGGGAGYYGGSLPYSNQTWLFANSSWERLNPVASPPAAQAATLTDVPGLNDLVLFDGQVGAKTWFFANDNWTGVNLAPPPSYRLYAASAYDPSSGTVWTIGGEGTGNSSTVELIPPFVATTPSASRLDLERGSSVTLTETAAGQGFGARYSWSGLPGCPSANASSINCVATETGKFWVNVTVSATNGTAETSPGLLLTVGSPPVLSPVTVASSPLFVGEPTSFSVGLSNGTGAVTVRWLGLPDGCSSSNTTHVQCTPAAPGNLSIRVEASDSAGSTSFANPFALTVFPPPTVETPQESRGSSDVGQPVKFSVALEGIAAFAGETWIDLPSGCVSSNRSQLPCVPDEPGEGNLSVTIEYAPGLYRISPSLPVLVFPDPTVSTPSASDAKPLAGSFVNFSISITPGSGGDEVVWSGLPNACESGVPSPTAYVLCRLPAGTYSVHANVTDSNNFTAVGASAVVAATPGLPQAPPRTNESSSPAPSVWPLEIAGAIAVVALGLGMALVLRSRARRR